MKVIRCTQYIVLLLMLTFISNAMGATGKIYFGTVDKDNQGRPFWGYYENSKFYNTHPDKSVTFMQYQGEVKNYLKNFKVAKTYQGINSQGKRIQLVMKEIDTSGELESYEGIFSYTRDPKNKSSHFGIIWTSALNVNYLPCKKIKLGPPIESELKEAATKLFLDALKVTGSYNQTSKIEFGPPQVEQIQSVGDIVTIVMPSKIKREDSTDDTKATVFFIYSIKDKRIIHGSFGHPEWSTNAPKVITIRPILYFRIKGDRRVYFLGEHSHAWEDWGYAIFDLKTGDVLIRTF